jgi:hypothetical protein
MISPRAQLRRLLQAKVNGAATNGQVGQLAR